jgi:hypothetical protein
MTKEEFIASFVAYMCKRAPFERFDDGETVADYAHGIAISYWEDPDCRDDPEECAESHMSYWGED